MHISSFDLGKLKNSTTHEMERVAFEIEILAERNPEVAADLQNIVTLLLDVVESYDEVIQEEKAQSWSEGYFESESIHGDSYDDGYNDGHREGREEGYLDGVADSVTGEDE